MGLDVKRRAQLERVVRNYLETASSMRFSATPGQIRAAAKNMVRAGRLPGRVADAIRIQTTGQMGQLAGGQEGAGRGLSPRLQLSMADRLRLW